MKITRLAPSCRQLDAASASAAMEQQQYKRQQQQYSSLYRLGSESTWKDLVIVDDEAVEVNPTYMTRNPRQRRRSPPGYAVEPAAIEIMLEVPVKRHTPQQHYHHEE